EHHQRPMMRCFVRHAATCLAMMVLGTPVASAASAQDGAEAGASAIARQGEVSVSLADFDAYVANHVPDGMRAGFVQSGERILNVIGNLLLERQRAAEAREIGLDKDPLLADQLGEGDDDAVLAKVRMERFADHIEVPDFTELARERYATSPSA